MKKLQNLGTRLSALEQKKILGGYGCGTQSCSVFTGTGTYFGNCGIYDVGGGVYICECVTSYGPYQPTSGTSHCYS